MNKRRKRLLRRQGSRCHYCDISVPTGPHPGHPRRPTYDHKHPLAERLKGASNEGVIACFACNKDKGNLPYADFVAIMQHAKTPEEGRRAAVEERRRRDRLRDKQQAVSHPPAPTPAEDDHAPT